MALLRRSTLVAGLALAAALLAWPASAQDFPARPVRMVVPFPPGAASDFLARVLGQKLGDTWGQQIVVDNRPGAGGLIGGTLVAKANPDGYTIALIGQPHLTVTLLSKQPPWDPLKDFSHIGLVASMPNAVTVGPGLPVNSLSELLSQVKAKPGYYNVGSAGIGSSSHLAAEMFNADSVKHLKTDDLRSRFQNAGADPAPSTPEEFYKVQQSEYARVQKIIKDLGLKPLY